MSIYCRYSLIVTLQDKGMLSLTHFIKTYLNNYYAEISKRIYNNDNMGDG